jgi:hypothetical protein
MNTQSNNSGTPALLLTLDFQLLTPSYSQDIICTTDKHTAIIWMGIKDFFHFAWERSANNYIYTISKENVVLNFFIVSP